jgi:hypothetical protein
MSILPRENFFNLADLKNPKYDEENREQVILLREKISSKKSVKMTNLFDPEHNDNMDNNFALLTNVQCS